MRKLFAVIRREFMVRVHTRAFVISTVLGPTLMAFLFVFPMLLESRDRAPKRIVVLDAASGEFGARVTDALAGARRGVGPDAAPRYVVTRLAAGAGNLALRAARLAARYAGIKGGVHLSLTKRIPAQAGSSSPRFATPGTVPRASASSA